MVNIIGFFFKERLIHQFYGMDLNLVKHFVIASSLLCISFQITWVSSFHLHQHWDIHVLTIRIVLGLFFFFYISNERVSIMNKKNNHSKMNFVTSSCLFLGSFKNIREYSFATYEIERWRVYSSTFEEYKNSTCLKTKYVCGSELRS